MITTVMLLILARCSFKGALWQTWMCRCDDGRGADHRSEDGIRLIGRWIGADGQLVGSEGVGALRPNGVRSQRFAPDRHVSFVAT